MMGGIIVFYFKQCNYKTRSPTTTTAALHCSPFAATTLLAMAQP
jgi:hypothetical protein